MPVIIEILNGINEILDKTSFWGRITRGAVGLITRDYGMVRDAIWGPGEVKEAVDELTKGFWKQQQQMYETRYEGLKLEQSFRDLGDEWDIFLGKLDTEEAWINLQDKFDQAEEAARRAFAENTPAAWREADLARIRAQEGVAQYIEKLGEIPPEIEAEILTAIDMAQYDRVKKLLDDLAKQRFVNYVPIRPGDTPSETTGRGTRKRSGTARADIFGPAQAGPNALSVNVNVAGSVTSEGDLIEAIRKGLVSAQRNGAQLVYSNV